MKKLTFLLLALLTLCLLVSCGGNDAPAGSDDETTAETGDTATDDKENKNGVLTINPDDYYKCVVFELPKDDFRNVIVDYMRKQSSLEWTCSADFSVSEEWENWGIALDFKKGQKYTGIPYADTKVSYSQFENALIDGKYTSESDKWKDVYGVQCVSSIMNSIQQFCPDVAGASDVMMPSYKQFQASVCGEYTVPEGVNRTADIISANTEDIIYTAYSRLKKGDIIFTKDDVKSTSHFRVLVEDPTIFVNGAGKFVPSRSSVKTIEQTNMFDATRTDGVKTTWYVDHIYSFADLYKTNYLPLTLEIYSKDRSECEIPYIYLDQGVDAELLAKSTMMSTVKSNFPIRYVFLDILDKATGEQVKRVKAMDMASSYSVNLRNKSLELFNGLENGEYTFVVTAGIAIGDAELERVDFTYNK